DFYGGIDAGVSQMMQVIQGEPLPPPRARRGTSDDDRLGSLLVPFFIFWTVGHVLKRLFGTFPASALVGIGTGIASVFILGFGILAIGAGFLAMIAALVLYSGALAGLPGRGGYYGGGGGGGFGGGGFSGGGGGFGGGGASGRW
ncbi:MAG TPA: YgcG family protein, partial [Nevskiaceae bacterium]|nr:YgcG family protein [Nevskiaceae bacterium]